MTRTELTASYTLDRFRVEVTADDPSVLRYLAAFFERTPDRCGLPPAARLTVSGTAPATDAPALRTAHGVTVTRNQDTVTVTGPRLRDRAITARKVVRALWLERLLAGEATILHASAAADARRVLIFTGASGAGKSSLMLDAVLRHGWQYLGDDRVALWERDGRLHLAPLPSVVRVRQGTARALGSRLPCAPPPEALLPGPPEFPAEDEPGVVVFLPLRAVAAQPLPVVCLAQRAATVVFTSLAPAHRPASLRPINAESAARLLADRVHGDRIAELTGCGLLPGWHLDPDHVGQATRRLLNRLVAQTDAWSYLHHGHLPIQLTHG